MRRVCIYLLLAVLSVTVSCLQDPYSPENDLDGPVVGYDEGSLTRAAVILTGAFDDSPEIREYGFEMAENSFGEGTGEIVPNPPKDGNGGFSYLASLVPGKVYSVRTFFTNGVDRKYSKTLTIKAPSTSVATLSDVSLSGGMLTARILDDGGSAVREVGFCCSESADPGAIRQHKIPATLADDNTFSLSLSSLEWGRVYHILAYAENSFQSSGDAFGYSHNPVEVAVTDDLPVSIADPMFERALLAQYDTDRNGFISFREIKAIRTLSVNTDGISDIGEIRLMPLLESLTCRGTSSGSGRLEKLDLGGNPALAELSCDNNGIRHLDLGATPLLRKLSVSGNPLESLDVSPCTELETLSATSCSSLKAIVITPEQSLRAERDYSKDAHTSFVLNPDSIIPVPDPHFRRYLVDSYDQNGDDRISVSEAAAITWINVCTDAILTLSGIEFFSNLTWLSCTGNTEALLSLGRLTELDVSHNPLEYLDCRNNPLLTDIWLRTGQEIGTFYYDSGVATVRYK